MSFTDLPMLSDLLQTHRCKSPTDDSPCTCKLVALEKSKPATADKRLRNWHEWMQRRRELHQKLGKLLQRAPGSLLMNSSEEYRTVKEKKIAMEYTKIPEPDLQRGCPGFWKMPLQLKDDCGEESSCFAVMSKEDKCEIPEIEHVGVPQQIMTEKDVLPRTRNSRVLWEQSTYVQERASKLEHKIKLVDPYKPDFDYLFIKGTSLDKPTSSKPLQQVAFSPIDTITNQEVTKDDVDLSILSLLINNFQIAPNLDISGTRKLYVIFDYDIVSREVATEYLTIQNQGTTALRFFWKAEKKAELFKDTIQEKSQEECFYFNKNEELIIPGQTIKFPIWFKTENPGTYCEFWEFCTKPKILMPSARFIIVLHASAMIGDLDKKMDAIRERLDSNIRERMIKETLSSVLNNIPREKFKPTIYSYNKKEVFETVNSKFNAFNCRSKYLYNKEVVRELQNFYKKVRRRSDPKCWNYRIDELKLLASVRQKKEEESKRLAKQQEGEKIKAESPKLSNLACEKTVFLNINYDYKKHVSHEAAAIHISNTKINKNAHLPEGTQEEVNKKSLTEQLDSILKKLECPTAEQNVEQTKYTQAYLILSTCFNKVNEEFEVLKERLGIILKTKYPKFPTTYVPPLYCKPTRLIAERLYDVPEKPPLTETVGTNLDQPVAEILLNIPLEDSKRRFRTYYNIPDTPPPQADKGKGKDKDKKGNKADKKGGGKDKKPEKNDKGKKSAGRESEKPATPDSDKDDGYIINEGFDPYAKIDFPVIGEVVEGALEEDDEVYCNIHDVLPAVQRQYKYNMYVIMYNYLDKAIASIVDMIEMQPQEHVPYAVIKEIEEPNYTRRLIDLKGLLVQENMDKLKAKLILYKYRKNSKLDWKSVEIQRQLRNTVSDSSLWSILKPYEQKPKLPESKPVSYPIEHYEVVTKSNIIQDDISFEKLPVLVNVSTSTLDGRLDPNWEDFKDIALQKDYAEEEKPDDLEAYVEKVISEISVQELLENKPDKETQKNTDEHVSDEEHFYPDSDGEETDFSIDSYCSREDSCSCEGYGVCNELEVNATCKQMDKL